MKSVIRTREDLQIQHFNTVLQAHREETLNSLRRIEAEQKEFDTGRAAEVGDFCTQSASREELFERMNRQRRLLQRIEAAIRRIEYGTFGECSICGETITHKRLEFMPWTEHCLGCQENLEQSRVSATTLSALHRLQRSEP